MSMYKSHVVTGKIIEIQADRILTQQGDAVCTYHSRYYMLPPVETGMEVERDPINASSILVPLDQAEDRDAKKSWITAFSWLPLHKKSANRI